MSELKINKASSGSTLTLSLEGRLDTTTFSQLDAVVTGELGGIKELVFEMSSLEFISSAGLRVLLNAQKIMNKQGTMVIKHSVPSVLKVFYISGFDQLLNVEK